jgi:hypothetical protein
MSEVAISAALRGEGRRANIVWRASGRVDGMRIVAALLSWMQQGELNRHPRPFFLPRKLAKNAKGNRRGIFATSSKRDLYRVRSKGSEGEEGVGGPGGEGEVVDRRKKGRKRGEGCLLRFVPREVLR